MAYNLQLSRDKAYELLDYVLTNGAHPIIVIDDPEGVARELFIDLLFADRKDTSILNYSDFIMNQAFSIDGMNELAQKRYIVVEDVKYLYGKSATSKILADFAETMQANDVGVIFIGRHAVMDMAEFTELAESTVQYVISLDLEGKLE